ncbi:hypothetical protein DSM106972_070440 [Dulcicalothrix desertica PCC 7102]|uniref:Lipoprotein n=1 Tax=Dulcicalothrix desertica PCC 7102 TaxID=232991 RepID=A0A433V4M2_9CYAN|nr:hypothetical protein [Dulcicalothrix desertica]RUT01038.1 hypothetical protein DSM106972_070440 [Dulcicalothrix desertica PCC 7102]TWH39188.1 hypothetical protein CAL7102_08401 [Dulcicalothrix desertica PCC 7102]
MILRQGFIKILFASFALVTMLLMTGCSNQIEYIATTPDGRVLIVQESYNDQTSLLECKDVKGSTPELHCRPFKITMVK